MKTNNEATTHKLHIEKYSVCRVNNIIRYINIQVVVGKTIHTEGIRKTPHIKYEI